MDEERITRRAELSPLEHAVSDTLDELNVRCHSMFSSWSYPVEFIKWLRKRGYEIVKAEDDGDQEATAALGAEAGGEGSG